MRDICLVDIEAALVRETHDAYLIKVDEDTFEKEAETYWLPKSRTEYTPSYKENELPTFTIPQWIAEEKGLV